MTAILEALDALEDLQQQIIRPEACCRSVIMDLSSCRLAKFACESRNKVRFRHLGNLESAMYLAIEKNWDGIRHRSKSLDPLESLKCVGNGSLVAGWHLFHCILISQRHQN